jgi:hypothetical protein
MPDAKLKSFAETFLKDAHKEVDDVDKERQHGITAFTLRVKYRNGRRIEAFAWSHYAGYQWAALADGQERLTLMFGTRAVIVEGQGLQNLLREINEGRRRTITEMTEPEARLVLAEGEGDKAVVSRITVKPDFEEIVKEIAGEEHDTGFARKVGR